LRDQLVGEFRAERAERVARPQPAECELVG
jgi:hypothetical protein